MSYYSVHVNDGHSNVSMPAGRHVTSPEVARDEAVWLLTELAKAKIFEGDEHLLVGVVKDDANRAIYRVLLTMTCTKLE
ncbi:MAG: DUF6894 family protein [Janthinobacterium lividum]